MKIETLALNVTCLLTAIARLEWRQRRSIWPVLLQMVQ